MEFISRKTPGFDIDGDYIANRRGIVPAVFIAIFSFTAALLGVAFLWYGINHWRDIPIQGFVGFLVGLLWTLLFAAQAYECVKGIAAVISDIGKRNRWLKQAVRSQVKIIDRKEEYNAYAESREEMWQCSLAILWPPSTQGELQGQVAWLGVSQRIYGIYKDQEVARLLFDPSDSNIFIIEGE